MKKPVQTGLLLLAAVALVVVLFQHFFPNDEKRIRRRLEALADILSVPEHPTLASGLLAGDRLRDFLAPDATVELELPGQRGRQVLAGRQEIIQAAIRTRPSLSGLRVDFPGLRVLVDPAGTTATVELTARATQPGQQDFLVQEFKLALRREDGQWRIFRAETVRTLTL